MDKLCIQTTFLTGEILREKGVLKIVSIREKYFMLQQLNEMKENYKFYSISLVGSYGI